jgi:hypothetical protein
MAHYAWINENNIVVNVTVGVDEGIIQGDIGGTSEAWETFYTNAINQEGVYVKRTSYNGNYRKNYAGLGFYFDSERDAFISPKCHDSAVLNEETCLWDCTEHAVPTE